MTSQKSPPAHMPATAMVLAAGLGTRMKPLTDTKPKPLIEVNGKALIDYALDRFADAGVKNAVVNVHYLADQVKSHLQSRSVPEINISDERELLLETGGGLKKALPSFGDAPLFCTNTDAIMLDRNAQDACRVLAERWDPEKMDALLLLSPIEETSGYDGSGDFDYHQDGHIEFRSGETADTVFTGLQIISPALIAEGPDGPFSTKVLWDLALQRERLFGAMYGGYWMHVGDPDGLKKAEYILKG